LQRCHDAPEPAAYPPLLVPLALEQSRSRVPLRIRAGVARKQIAIMAVACCAARRLLRRQKSQAVVFGEQHSNG